MLLHTCRLKTHMPYLLEGMTTSVIVAIDEKHRRTKYVCPQHTLKITRQRMPWFEACCQSEESMICLSFPTTVLTGALPVSSNWYAISNLKMLVINHDLRRRYKTVSVSNHYSCSINFLFTMGTQNFIQNISLWTRRRTCSCVPIDARTRCQDEWRTPRFGGRGHEKAAKSWK